MSIIDTSIDHFAANDNIGRTCHRLEHLSTLARSRLFLERTRLTCGRVHLPLENPSGVCRPCQLFIPTGRLVCLEALLLDGLDQVPNLLSALLLAFFLQL